MADCCLTQGCVYANRAENVTNGQDFFPYGDVYIGRNRELLVWRDCCRISETESDKLRFDQNMVETWEARNPLSQNSLQHWDKRTLIDNSNSGKRLSNLGQITKTDGQRDDHHMGSTLENHKLQIRLDWPPPHRRQTRLKFLCPKNMFLFYVELHTETFFSYAPKIILKGHFYA